MIIILIYLLVIPSLGTFDLKNILMNLTFHYFPYYGTNSLANVQEISIIFCLGYFVVVTFLTIVLIYIISKRQNKYV